MRLGAFAGCLFPVSCGLRAIIRCACSVLVGSLAVVLGTREDVVTARFGIVLVVARSRGEVAIVGAEIAQLSSKVAIARAAKPRVSRLVPLV